jgi:hypothetical protein
MANLFDSVVTESNVWRGAARFLYADAGTSFPGELESVINPTTYALAAGWNDFGGTGDEGLTITREFEGMDGVPIDQRAYNLFEGDPTKWMMKVSAKLMETDLDNLRIAWETPAKQSITGSSVSQTKLLFNAPTTLVERMVAAIQQHSEQDNLRVFVFRTASLEPGARELLLKADSGTGVPLEMNLEPDPAVADADGPFGALYEETAS